jgi:hypothetical protein
MLKFSQPSFDKNTKLQHWRAFQGSIGPETAPVLEFQ